MIFRYPPFPEVVAFGEDRRKSGIACHHPKLLVLQREDTIRVVITSANLGPKQVILLSLYFLCFDLESWWRRTDFMSINYRSNYVPTVWMVRWKSDCWILHANILVIGIVLSLVS